MRMITARFARALQGCTSRLCVHFLLTFQEVMPISKTRNRLDRTHNSARPGSGAWAHGAATVGESLRPARSSAGARRAPRQPPPAVRDR
jgi:hypothetical protein